MSIHKKIINHGWHLVGSHTNTNIIEEHIIKINNHGIFSFQIGRLLVGYIRTSNIYPILKFPEIHGD